MRRNNEDRTGAAPPDEHPVAATQTVVPQTPNQDSTPSVGLNFVIPTEFVELPSRGKYYPEGHPLHNEETVEIRHMTAREEDILTSKTLLKKGVALDRLVESVVVDKRIKTDDLLVGDKSAILLMSRIAAYGNEYDTRVTCPHCTSQVRYTFDLFDATTLHPDDVEEPQFTETENGTFIIKLPRSQVDTEVRLLTGLDEKNMARIGNKKKKARTISDGMLTSQMQSFIVSLNGVTDRMQIKKFIDSMPAKDSRFLRRVYTELTPTIDLTQDFACSECDAELEMEVPFTTDFFWPK